MGRIFEKKEFALEVARIADQLGHKENKPSRVLWDRFLLHLFSGSSKFFEEKHEKCSTLHEWCECASFSGSVDRVRLLPTCLDSQYRHCIRGTFAAPTLAALTLRPRFGGSAMIKLE